MRARNSAHWWRTVALGKLLISKKGRRNACTAIVVDISGHKLIATTAHALFADERPFTGTSAVFVAFRSLFDRRPATGFGIGHEPSTVIPLDTAVVPRAWSEEGDVSSDVAFAAAERLEYLPATPITPGDNTARSITILGIENRLARRETVAARRTTIELGPLDVPMLAARGRIGRGGSGGPWLDDNGTLVGLTSIAIRAAPGWLFSPRTTHEGLFAVQRALATGVSGADHEVLHFNKQEPRHSPRTLRKYLRKERQ